ncbi:hypothetical protein ER308_08065 [Egibacter rhizosphaerae]|uniref:Galactose oxidase n=1 Tax=Egibacter rhizosphaerae TaxID=1670831 RepID=A0A411YE76_9ACTN|nr:kelch repeat-containing protein [Egibacter rhizosphaerae]QBI19508.1 hypothetical protein ER308_08065 [Egibacter rhizosphaerae]
MTDDGAWEQQTVRARRGSRRGALVALGLVAAGALWVWAGSTPFGESGVRSPEPVERTPVEPAGEWRELPDGPVGPRTGATAAVLDGDGGTGEAVIWGGTAAPSAPLGAALDADAGRWRELPEAPLEPRVHHAAVWTGEEFLVWGGRARHGPGGAGGRELGDGAAYDPIDDAWRPLPRAPIPGRVHHRMVWTGSEAIVWGGRGEGFRADGAAYDPARDAWRTIRDAPIEARARHAAVAGDGELLVWGGEGEGGQRFAGGARYFPRLDTWSVTPPADTGRADATAVWNAGASAAAGGSETSDTSAGSPVGGQMIVWGGVPIGDEPDPLRAYDPMRASWHRLTAPPLAPRSDHAATWTDDALFIWGGRTSRPLEDGAVWDHAQGFWRPLPPPPLGGRVGANAVWTGEEVLVLGGFGGERPGRSMAWRPD